MKSLKTRLDQALMCLREGAVDKSSEFRNFVLSNIAADRVESRYLVLRDFLRTEGKYKFICFTDKRSPKVKDLSQNSSTCCVFFSKKKGIQIKTYNLTRRITDPYVIERYWKSVPSTSWSSYSSIKAPSSIFQPRSTGLPSLDSNTPGFSDTGPAAKNNFSVFENIIQEMDCLWLLRDGNIRTSFVFSESRVKMNWLIP